MEYLKSQSGSSIMTTHDKRMAHFHLPFSSPQETSIRSLSMYILAQYLFNKDTESNSININLGDFEKIYAEVNNVNNDFSTRLRTAGEKDANLKDVDGNKKGMILILVPN